ncbi:MAG: translation initiation factor 2 [Bacillota bacterium]
MDQEAELAGLKARIRLLEQRIQGLRASRRILMNLLAAQEREKRIRIHRLETENQRLQRRSTRLARLALESNIRLVRLAEGQDLAGKGHGDPYPGPRNTGTD